MSTIPSDQNAYTASNPPAYGTRPIIGPYGAPVLTPRNGLGTAALVLGILALLSGVILIGAILGVVAIILGFAGRARVKRGEATNGGSAMAGILTGLVGIIIAGIVIAAGVSWMNSPTGKNYTNCVKAANGNQAAINQCTTTYVK
ncbi:MAG: hypothetical protein QOJ11_1687 [Frankiales bacterium]|jgi:hypothetical protein|nr:hypothetical protein [Frankiales bacterium]